MVETTAEAKAEQVPMDGPEDKGPARGRIIVRNLVFDMREVHLKKAFQSFGTIESVNVPLNQANNQNRGFAFVEFSTKEEALKAISAMNQSKFKGRSLTVELSLPKASYEAKVQHQIDNTNQTKEDIIKPKSIKIEEKKKAETPVPEPVAPPAKAPRPPKVKDAADQTTDATLFVRNVAWDVTQEQFKKHMELFG